MSKRMIESSSTPKKAYSKPKLATHGDVRKLTQKCGAVGIVGSVVGIPSGIVVGVA